MQQENYGIEYAQDGQQQQLSRQESRSNQRDPRDSHHSNYRSTNGGYSVANSQSYTGKAAQGYYGYDDSDQSSRGDDDMW